MENQETKAQVLELTEFETKYEVDEKLLHPFKKIVEDIGYEKFLYVQGPDVFFRHPDKPNVLGRYRKAEHGDSGAEFTLKEKHTEGNNVKRTETNWKVGKTPYEEIEQGAKIMGFKRNTQIWKSCHVYKLSDANLVFYTVRDEDNKYAHFIEIEVREDTKFTEDEAWSTIKKYEEKLAPLGITAQRRKRLSLYEMYRKPI